MPTHPSTPERLYRLLCSRLGASVMPTNVFMRLCIERRSAAVRRVSVRIVGIVEQAEQLYDP
mgnify:CR=1 FL=1